MTRRWTPRFIPAATDHTAEYTAAFYAEDGATVVILAPTLERLDDVSDRIEAELKRTDGRLTFGESAELRKRRREGR